jgi:metal-dependent amidase/aminoacylase/carboxypeptidase family protein
MALQTVVSRNVDPLQMAVVTVGAFHAGEANNVIPPQATLELSVRALDRDVRATCCEQRIKALAAAQAAELRRAGRGRLAAGLLRCWSTPGRNRFRARGGGIELVGPERVTPAGPPLTGSEDFAFMLEQRARQLPADRQRRRAAAPAAEGLHGAQPRLRLQRRQRARRRGVLGAAGGAVSGGVSPGGGKPRLVDAHGWVAPSAIDFVFAS